jgi:hypothetical protein
VHDWTWEYVSSIAINSMLSYLCLSSPSNSGRHTVKSSIPPGSALIFLLGRKGMTATAWTLKCEERLRPRTVVADATCLETA